MPRKVLKEVEEIQEETEVEEQIERLHSQAYASEPIKQKKTLSEAQLMNLAKAREMASLKKKELKEAKDKSNLLEQEKNKLKAMEYDQIKQKQQEFVPAAPAATPAKKKVKKIIEVEETESEEEEYEEVIVKKRVGRPRVQSVQQQPQQDYNHLLYKSAQETIQQKVLEERAKNLMNHLMPRC